jgi:ATP-dependent Lon protease
MIRRSLRKYKDDSKNDDDIDNSSDNLSDDNSDEYIPSEESESEDEYNDTKYSKKRKKNKPGVSNESDESDEENVNLNEKLLKSNVILVLNTKKHDLEEYGDDCDEYNNDCDDNDINNMESKKKKKYSDVLCKYNKQEKNYFNKLTETEKQEIYDLELNLNNNNNDDIPTRFKLLKYNMSDIIKKSIIYNLDQLNYMCKSSSEYFKLHNWVTTLSKIPINKYNKLEIASNQDVSKYLENIKRNIDNNIYGHEETKEQIIRILAQWISNPEKTGYVIGIKGPPGVGKTKLVKECICNAMNFPLAFVSLGGVDDSSYLSGFNYTYEGSKYGKILECLIKAQVMNPVFLFDELDKVSATSRGDEIINTLIHITDPIQNEKYTDKYFQEIDLDLSKSIIIFTYNNEEYVNPILKDRMITINVNGYNLKEKYTIAKNYLIDELLPKYNMKPGDIIFEDKLLEYVIQQSSSDEGGVRNLKREINNIISWVNMMRYIKIDNVLITLPYEVKMDYYNKYCKKITKKPLESSGMYL